MSWKQVHAIFLVTLLNGILCQNDDEDITKGPPTYDKPWVPAWGYFDGNPYGWKNEHDGMINQTVVNKDKIQILFYGDSKVERWKIEGKAIWDKYYAPRGGYNYGIGGDSTRQVLWRKDHQELDGIKPKILVFMIGGNNFQNNYNRGTDEEIVQALYAIIDQLREKLPSTEIIFVTQLPRESGTIARAKHINDLLDEHYSQNPNERLTYCNFYDTYLKPDGTQNIDLYIGDKVHLNEKGYQILADLLEPFITKLLNNNY